MYTREQVDAAFRNYQRARARDHEGDATSLIEHGISRGELEIAGIADGEFLFRLVDDERAKS